MESRRIEVADGVSLMVGTSLDDTHPALVLLHGNGSHHRQFDIHEAALRNEFQLVSPSLRGHGGSSLPPPAPDAFALSTLAADVLACLDALGIAAAHVVGNSVGGLVGYELVRAAPERVRSLVTFGTTAQLRTSASTRRALVATQWLIGPRGAARLFSATSPSRETARAVRQLFRSTSRRAIVEITKHVADYDYTDVVATMNAPLVIVRAEHDTSINRELTSTLHAALANPAAEIVDVAGAGHFANLDRPNELEALIRRAARRVDTDQRPRAVDPEQPT